MSYAKQTATEPLFENILWSRPEHTKRAGKLLVIGGNLHDFKQTQQCFLAAQKSGAGEVKVVLPRALKKLVGEQDAIEFATSTSAGSFSKEAYPELEGYVSWADGVLFAGEFSSNSETEQVMLDVFLALDKPALLRDEATHIFLRNFEQLPREGITLEVTADILRSHIHDLQLTKALTSTSSAEDVKAIVESVATTTQTNVCLQWRNFILLHGNGEGTQTFVEAEVNPATLAAYMSTLHMQFPTKPLPALTTGAYLAL